MADMNSWHDDLASLLDDASAAPYAVHSFDLSVNRSRRWESSKPSSRPVLHHKDVPEGRVEGYGELAKEFARAWCEMVWELGKAFGDVARQNVVTDDSFVVKKVGRPCAEVVSGKLRLLNEYLPEDKDPAHAWPVVLLVFLLALLALCVNRSDYCMTPPEKEVEVHPPSAYRIILPDARHLAYKEQGVRSDQARFTVIIPHAFLFSRMASIPGAKESLLEEFGVRLISYDLPGFGESDPHPARNLNTSALDMLYLANALGVSEKFWVLCFSSGCIHAWAAINYIPYRVAGASLVAPMINPYDPSLTKEESRKIWEKWVHGKKLTYLLGRHFPRPLSFIFRKKFFSGRHGLISDRLSLSLSARDMALVEKPEFQELWRRNVEESVRQGSITPFVEEAVLQVSRWDFSLKNLHPRLKCQSKGILPWLKSIYSQPECESTGFLGPLHLWQGMDDEVVPPTVTDYVARVLPRATIHKLPSEGHFSFLFFCDECQKQIFSTLFGHPKGPLKEEIKGDLLNKPSPVTLS
ncbi:hypothetical protein MLD38_020389 [Melastoma candidum]|uniref:Uncharacterized protein n=1 Tax=Melastoma candidum TaxID=119954 RepID=A0ACB9QD47_9MYRT|nr:hypothetical protein MLD38_020389 [Melastoma candidum]